MAKKTATKKRTATRQRPISNTKRAFDTLQEAIHSDSGFAWTWQCSLATAIMEEGTNHEQANRAAARIMQELFSVDVTKCDQWKSFHWVGEAAQDTVPISHDIRFAVLMERLEKMVDCMKSSVSLSNDTTQNLRTLIQAKKATQLGIEPRPVWLEKRRDALYAAIGRCGSGGMASPTAWITELFDLNTEIEKP